MKLMKKKGYEGTVRSVMDDEKTKCLGVVGTVHDLLEVGILEAIDGVSVGMWMFIPAVGRNNAVFGGTREDALSGIVA